MTNSDISRAMQSAISHALSEGGKIYRFPDGFWRVKEDDPMHFGTTTIRALVKRGLAEYSSWKMGGGEKSFPVQITINKEKWEK